MLAKWVEHDQLDATYGSLLMALVKGGEVKAAKTLCKLVAEKPDPQFSNHDPSPPKSGGASVQSDRGFSLGGLEKAQVCVQC